MPLLLQGDCLEVMRDLSDNSVDCFICDLPYGQLAGGGITTMSDEERKLKYHGNTGATIVGCSWDIKIDLAAFWIQVKRLARDDKTPVLMFCNTKFGNDLINSNPSWFRYDLVWDKGRGVSFLLANKMPMKSHEMIYVFAKKSSFYRRIDIATDKPNWSIDRSKEKMANRQYGVIRSQTYHSPTGDISGNRHLINRTSVGGDGTRCALSVVQVISSVRSGKHPTEKPVALYKWLLERYCPPGGTVLDPTAGSFNAILAAEELGMEGIGIEKDETFFEKAVKKWSDVSGNIIEHV